tara:strand:- start:126 stop:797 length:672 start_codon:yes stop_codon:yes gene_type:complete
MAWKEVLTSASIGSTIQAYDAQLADLAGLAVTDSNFIVGNGSNFVLESGSTARTSMGAAASGANGDITSLTAVTSVNGGAGSRSLFTDAGSNTITIGGSGSTVTIAGDLTVSGTTTSIDTTNLNVEDNVITCNSGASGSATVDSGLEIERGDDTNQSLYWDEGDDQWAIFAGTIASAATGTTATAYVTTFKSVANNAAPTGDHQGLGQTFWDSTAEKLYVRVS